MKRLSLGAVFLLLFLLALVRYPDILPSSATGKGHDFTYRFATETDLQQAVERVRVFEEELYNEGFRQVSVALSNDTREVTLTGRYDRLGKVEVRLWTNTRLEIEEPHIGVGFNAYIRNEATEAAWDELDARFRVVVRGKEF